MAKSNLYNLTTIVQRILETNPAARNDDMYLYWCVLAEISYDWDVTAHNMSLKGFLLNWRELGAPSLESVGRCRRKLQEKHSELCADKDVERRRMDRVRDFRAYALGGAV